MLRILQIPSLYKYFFQFSGHLSSHKKEKANPLGFAFKNLVVIQRKGLENEAFSNWNPQAETALFAEENREFQDQRSMELICLASVKHEKSLKTL